MSLIIHLISLISQFLSDFSLVIHAGKGLCQDSCDRDKDIRLFKIFLLSCRLRLSLEERKGTWQNFLEVYKSFLLTIITYPLYILIKIDKY